MSSAQGLITPIGDNDLIRNICTSQSLNAALNAQLKPRNPKKGQKIQPTTNTETETEEKRPLQGQLGPWHFPAVGNSTDHRVADAQHQE